MKYIKYRETKEHGTFDFPMEFYHVGQAHPRYEMSFHWHIEYEIIRILKGELLMTIGEEEFNAKAGDIIFIKGGLLHGGIPKNCLYECIVFNLDSLMTASPAGEGKKSCAAEGTLSGGAVVRTVSVCRFTDGCNRK